MNIDPKLNSQIIQFVDAVQSLIEQSRCNDRAYDKLHIEPGRRYVKIVRRNCTGAGASVYCFIDKNGDILKAASWNAPAPRGVRGNIFNPDYDIQCCDRFGLKYLR